MTGQRSGTEERGAAPLLYESKLFLGRIRGGGRRIYKEEKRGVGFWVRRRRGTRLRRKTRMRSGDRKRELGSKKSMKRDRKKKCRRRRKGKSEVRGGRKGKDVKDKGKD